MRIHNVRLGHAANSSSSHSLIFLPGTVEDYLVEDREFGWQQFTAASQEVRQDYLSLLLFQNLCRLTSEEQAAAIVSQWMGKHFPYEALEDGEPVTPGYIDHQSVYSLPLQWDGRGIDKPFFDEFRRYLLQPGLVILGGSDECPDDHPLDNGQAFCLELPQYDDCWVARKDEAAGYWAIFNRETGAKIRFSFDRDAPTPTKATAPELVDIKITDQCPYRCKFCYTDSQPEGRHATLQVLTNLAWALGELRVFEVALGGGEPTLHPDFLRALSLFRERGVIPNFTTKNRAWLQDAEFRARVRECCGRVAFSVVCAQDVYKLYGALHAAAWCPLPSGCRIGVGSQVGIQVIVGVTPPRELGRILDAARDMNLPTTLLGFKTTGRGSRYLQVGDAGEVLQMVLDRRKEGCLPPLSIDTVLAAQWAKRLPEEGIPSWLFTTEEGGFSCYIDAVRGSIGRSSYGETGSLVPLSVSSEKVVAGILEAFATF